MAYQIMNLSLLGNVMFSEAWRDQKVLTSVIFLVK